MCCKEKKPEDEQLCIEVHTINNICDTDPLDNKIIKHKKQALPYITVVANALSGLRTLGLYQGQWQ